MKSRWIIVRRSPRAVEVELRAWVARRFCCLSVCSWFRWEDRRRHVSVLVIWRERVAMLRTWPTATTQKAVAIGSLRGGTS